MVTCTRPALCAARAGGHTRIVVGLVAEALSRTRRGGRCLPLGGQSKEVKNGELSVEQVSFYRWYNLGDDSSSDVSVCQGGPFHYWCDCDWCARSGEHCDLQKKVDCTYQVTQHGRVADSPPPRSGERLTPLPLGGRSAPVCHCAQLGAEKEGRHRKTWQYPIISQLCYLS